MHLFSFPSTTAGSSSQLAQVLARCSTSARALPKPASTSTLPLLALGFFLALTLVGRGATYSNSVSAGYNLIANQLDGTNNLLDTVFPNAQDNDQIFTWNHALQDFNQPDIFVAGFGWFDSLFNASSTTLAPGQGAFYVAAQAYSFPVTGTPRVPSLPIPQLRDSYHLVSRQIPGPGTYENIVGLPPENGSKFIRFNRGTQDYETNIFNGATWSVGAPSTAAVGESVFIYLPLSTDPILTQQPVSQAVSPGGTATFTVSAIGDQPLNYGWRRNGTALLGQTSSSLTLSNVQAPALGGYSCVVGNAFGAVTSVVAILSFLQHVPVNLPAGYSFVAKPLANTSPQFPNPPSGTRLFKWNVAAQNYSAPYTYTNGPGWQPTEPTVAVGEGVLVQLPSPGTLNFTGAVVTPVLPVTLEPGLNLLGAQAPISGGFTEVVGPPQEGSVIHRWKRTGSPTNVASPAFRISYFRDGIWHDNPPPVLGVGEAAFFSYVEPAVITVPPTGATNITPGQGASFTVTVSGAPPIHYQWQLNGENISGATGATYSIPAASAGDAGSYTVAVGNGVGDITSAPVPLTLDVAGFGLTDSFALQGTVNDLTRLLSSHNRSATTESGEPQHAGKRTGASVWLTWQAPPVSGIMTMSAAGSGFDNVLAVYTGSSVSNLVPVDANDDDAGHGCGMVLFNTQADAEYRVCVSGVGDGAGDILLGWNFEETSDVLPEFATQPQDLTAAFGGTAQLSVTVTNTPVTYQWFRNGVAIAATNATLTISNATAAASGRYFVRVANAGRYRDSALVALQLETPPPGQALTGARAEDKLFDLGPPGGFGSGLSAPGPKFGPVAHGYSGAIAPSTYRHLKAVGEPNHAGITGGASTWYVVPAEANGTLYVNSDLSDFDTVLAAYIGPGDSYLTLTNITSDNDSGLDGLDSRMNFPVQAGRLYFVALDGVGGATGLARIGFQLVRPLVLTNLLYTNLSGGRFTMKILCTPDTNVLNRVQYATNLVSPNWITLTNYRTAQTSFNFTNNNAGPGTNRIYRVVNTF